MLNPIRHGKNTVTKVQNYFDRHPAQYDAAPTLGTLVAGALLLSPLNTLSEQPPVQEFANNAMYGAADVIDGAAELLGLDIIPDDVKPSDVLPFNRFDSPVVLDPAQHRLEKAWTEECMTIPIPNGLLKEVCQVS